MKSNAQTEVYGGPFKVYATKDFPGLAPSTELSKVGVIGNLSWAEFLIGGYVVPLTAIVEIFDTPYGKAREKDFEETTFSRTRRGKSIVRQASSQLDDRPLGPAHAVILLLNCNMNQLLKFMH
ncbi:hypothetical protein C0995_009865 [Termitomyces sp. Mi166|nr:hypothetical protein C0995_009865 [Termitomyces sp. Mi166\